MWRPIAVPLRVQRRLAGRCYIGTMNGPKTAEEFNDIMEKSGGHQYNAYKRLYETYGDMMVQRADSFGVDIVTLFHPKDIKAVMLKEGPFPRGLGQALLPFTKFYKENAPNGLNLGRIDGPPWKQVRKPMAKHMMNPRAARSYLPHIGRVLKDCSEHLPANATNLHDYMPKVTFEMICSILLDLQPGIVSGKASEFDENFVRTARKVFPMMADLMSPKEMQTFIEGKSPLWGPFEETMLEIMDMGGVYITNMKARLEADGAADNEALQTSYFAKLMNSESGLDEHQMNINFSNLIFAGVDTTSNVMQWTLYHLARNPEKQEKLREEAARVLGGGNVLLEHYKKMKYHKMVMKESYRLTPPVFGSARYLPDDFELNGHLIPKNTMIRLHPLPFLQSEEVWEDPDKFIPERWHSEDGMREAMGGIEGSGCPMGDVAKHPYLWIVPFGVGKRMCLGARLAEAEVVAMLARFVQDYHIELRPDSPVPVPVFKMGMIEPFPSPTYNFTPVSKAASVSSAAAPQTTPMESARVALKEMLGDRLSFNDSVIQNHSSIETGYNGWSPPEAVAFINDKAELSEVVKVCKHFKVPLVPYGAGTSVEGHIDCVEGGLMLDLSAMNGILEVNEMDMDCRVQAGVTREALNDYIRHSGLHFPVDPGANATIGGMCSTNASGTTTVRYGNMQANVLGLEAVMADGSVIHTGGRARKSSAGYDLTRLLLGSEGTLAIITEVQLKLHPQPEAVSAAVCAFSDLDRAVEAVTAVCSFARPARMELLDKVTMEALDGYQGQSFEVAPTVFFEFHGSTSAVGEEAEVLASICEEYGGSSFQSATKQEDRGKLWKARHDAFWAVKAKWPGKDIIATDVCVPVSRLADCIRETSEDIEGLKIHAAPIFGHVGDGNFHLLVVYDSEDAEDVERVKELEHRLIMRALGMGGTCTGEHGIGTGKSKYLEKEFGSTAVEAMRTIKTAMDPSNLLNPGKIIPSH
jgi:D-lactate dehydrogenase (cytochrome)